MIKFRDDLWYLAHPYTVMNDKGEYVAGGEEANFRLCCYRTARLIEKGFMVYSPIAHTHPIHIHYPPFVGKEVHKMWYDFDNKLIESVDFAGIILAPLWETSEGCKAEKALFAKLGKQVKLYEWMLDGRWLRL